MKTRHILHQNQKETSKDVSIMAISAGEYDDESKLEDVNAQL
jgi:hypothetical protein